MCPRGIHKLHRRKSRAEMGLVMEVMQIICLFLIACLGSANWCYAGDSLFDRPIIISSLVGAVLGDFQAGLIIGGQLELAWIGIYAIGVSLPSDVVSGAIIGTYVAITTGTSFEVAAAVGLPTGILIAYVKTFIRSAMSPAVGIADRYAENGEIDKLCRLHHIFGLTNALPPAICSVLFIIAGSPFIEKLVNVIPESVMTGLSVASNMLPAVGFAMLLSVMWDKKYVPLFFLGFVVMSYFSPNIIALTIIVLCLALFKVFMMNGSGSEADVEVEIDE